MIDEHDDDDEHDDEADLTHYDIDALSYIVRNCPGSLADLDASIAITSE